MIGNARRNEAAGGSQSRWRETNERRVIDALVSRGAQTQADLARGTGLSRATVSTIVRELAAGGAVSVTATPGRRGSHVRAVPVHRCAAGIDIAADGVRVALCSIGGSLISEMVGDAGGDDPTLTAVRLLDESLALAGSTRSALVGIGMRAAGPAAALAAALGMPVRTDDDGTVRALAEATWGAGRGARQVAYVEASERLLARLIVDGRPHRARTGPAGEIGHLVVDADGEVCRCGNRGCLETVAGTAAVLRAVRREPNEPLTWPDALRLAGDGDPRCRDVLGGAGRLLGIAIGRLCTLLAPGAVVLAGDLAAAGEVVLAPLRESLHRHAVPVAAEGVRVMTATLGERTAALGATALATACGTT
ncbi:MAG: ROK family protein [Frankiaceae bacterium]